MASITYIQSARKIADQHSAYVVVIAVRTVLVALFILAHVLSECLFALFADKGHLCRLCERMRLVLCMAFGAVVPLLAAGSTYRDLCVEDVFAGWVDESETVAHRCPDFNK